MKSIATLICGVVLFLSIGVNHASAKDDPPAKATTFTGFLMDNMCAKGVMKDSSKALAKAAKHDKECLVEDMCSQTGYGIVTDDGKYLKFDAKGSDLAAAVAKATKKDNNIRISVQGNVQDGVLVVTQVTEAN